MDNTIQFLHKTWGGVWVVIAISGIKLDLSFTNGTQIFLRLCYIPLSHKNIIDCHLNYC